MNEGHAVYKSEDGLEFWLTCDGEEFARHRWSLFSVDKMDFQVQPWMEKEMREHMAKVHPIESEVHVSMPFDGDTPTMDVGTFKGGVGGIDYLKPPPKNV